MSKVIALFCRAGIDTEVMKPAQRELLPLTPLRPPGRSDRKAWQYASEIHRLRGEGYTIEAIREALLSAGVSVSQGTVRREIARPLDLLQQDGAQSSTSLPKAPPTSVHAPDSVRQPQPNVAGVVPTVAINAAVLPGLDVQIPSGRRWLSLIARIFLALGRLRSR